MTIKNNVEINKMVEINKKQAEFYDCISEEDDVEEQTGYAKNKKANLLTRVWAAMRYRHQIAFEKSGVDIKKIAFHDHWIASKRGGRFLEIGCFRGTRASWPLIEAAGTYKGIDLSESAVAVLNKKIQVADLITKASASAEDFLLMDDDYQFDLIFAHGVLHHFENSKILFSKINNLLSDDGILIFTEPSMVNKIFFSIRMIYRPFQSDSEWEWPFTKQTVSNLEQLFRPVDGFGWGRWSMPFSLIMGVPFIENFTNKFYLRLLAKELNDGWNERVWLNSTVTAIYKKS
jgi:SAM-dependent methyltransferase